MSYVRRSKSFYKLFPTDGSDMLSYTDYNGKHQKNFFVERGENSIATIRHEETKKKSVFSHFSSWRRAWEYLMLIVCASPVFELSFIGIFVNEMKIVYYIPFLLFDILYILDIFIVSNTSYLSHGVFSKKRIKIIKHYGKFAFILHIIDAIPLGWIGIILKSRYKYLIFASTRLLRLKRAIVASDNIQRSLCYLSNSSMLFLLIFLLVLFIHLFACIFYLSGYFEGIYQSWIAILGWDYLPPTKLYVVSVYFVLTTITAIGYGDITPQTSSERIIVIFIQLIGVLCNGYIVGVLVSVLIDPVGSSFQKSFQRLWNYMLFKKLPKELRHEVLHYYQDNWMKYHGTENPNEVYKFIPETRKDRLKLDLTLPCFRAMKLTEDMSEKLLIGLQNITHSITFLPKEIIFKEGEIVPDLYMFSNGIVETYQKNVLNETIDCSIGFGTGDFELLYDKPRDHSLKALTYLEGWFITREDLLIWISNQTDLKNEFLSNVRNKYPDYFEEIKNMLLSTKVSKPKPSIKKNEIVENNYIDYDSDSFEFVPVEKDTSDHSI